MLPPQLARYIRRLRTHLSWVELPVLLLVAVLGVGAWAFVEVAESVSGDETHQLDESVLLAMRNPNDLDDPVGPLWVEEMGRDVTGLGGVAVLVFLTLSATGYLLLSRRRRAALFVFVAVVGGIVLSTLLKQGFDRPRPDLVPHEAHVYSASFPSGHSLMAAVVYLTLGALLARIHSRRSLKVFFLSMAILLTVAIGVSRVYMGVHWPTDVLAGWSVGAVWAVLCWMAAVWFQQRDVVEEPPEGVPEGGALEEPR